MRKITNLKFIFLLIPFFGFGQTISADNRIVVVGEATIEIPADNVIFNIELKFTDSTDIQKAYSNHKIAESKLVDFLKELKIPNKNISYTLISVGRQIDYDDDTRTRQIVFGTSQNISVTIEDVKNYAGFMMKLISAGFSEVTTSFTSSKENNFKEMLIQKAIESARKKAEAMALASERQIKKIVKVMDAEESDPDFRYMSNSSNFNEIAVNSNSIIEIPQTITKNYSVKVVFSLK